MKKLFTLTMLVCAFAFANAQTAVVTYALDGNTNDDDDTTYNATSSGISYTTDFEGMPNRAAQFNGTSSWMLIPGSAALAGSYNYRLSLWFKTNNHQKGGGLAFIGDNTVDMYVSNYTPVLYIDTFGKLNTFMYDGGVTPLKSSDTVNDNQWHHATVAYDVNPMSFALTQMLFLDGIMVNSRTGTIGGTPNFDNYYIGACNARGIGDVPDTWMYFDGAIDEVNTFASVLNYDTWINLMFKLSSLPPSVSVDSGAPAALTATHTNFIGESHYYTWKKGTTVISTDTALGYSNWAHIIPSTLLTDAGNYTCEISTLYGKTLVSQIAVLNVTDTSTGGGTGIDDGFLVDTKLYPNPATEFIQISTNTKLPLTIYNLKGELMLQSTTNELVRIADFATGNYIVRIADSQKIYSTQFTKQ